MERARALGETAAAVGQTTGVLEDHEEFQKLSDFAKRIFCIPLRVKVLQDPTKAK